MVLIIFFLFFKDRIIPEKWTSKVYRHQWQLLLRADQGVDRGPQSMTDSEFEKLCLRCGRTLNSGGQVSFVYFVSQILCINYVFWSPSFLCLFTFIKVMFSTALSF